MVNLNSNKPILQSLYLILPPPQMAGSHLGRGIWQRLPRFPPSPVNLCLHLHYSADPPGINPDIQPPNWPQDIDVELKEGMMMAEREVLKNTATNRNATRFGKG